MLTFPEKRVNELLVMMSIVSTLMFLLM